MFEIYIEPHKGLLFSYFKEIRDFKLIILNIKKLPRGTLVKSFLTVKIKSLKMCQIDKIKPLEKHFFWCDKQIYNISKNMPL